MAITRLYPDTKASNRVLASRRGLEALRAAPLDRLGGSDVFFDMGISNAAAWISEFDLSGSWSLRLYEIVGGARPYADDFVPAEVKVRWFGETLEMWPPVAVPTLPAAAAPAPAPPEHLEALPIEDDPDADHEEIVEGDPTVAEPPLPWCKEMDAAVNFWSEREEQKSMFHMNHCSQSCFEAVSVDHILGDTFR